MEHSQGAEAAVAAIVFFEGGEELGFAKIGPEGLSDDEFGVRDLPKEEVADAHFAAGANHEIRIGNVMGVKVLGENLFGDVSGVKLAGFDFCSNAANGFNNFGAAAVTQSHDERKAVVL